MIVIVTIIPLRVHRARKPSESLMALLLALFRRLLPLAR
jgi:hypothetical protein